ncbi:MAG: TonB-dependent receptor, partial [Duncaniella sp.]|nr:TonB-dependent receptor [Duncaniella sp.]
RGVYETGVGRYHEHARDRLKLSLLTLALSGESSLSSRNTLSYGVTAQTQKIMERSRDWELRDSSGYSLPSVSGDLRVIYNLLSRQDESSRRFSAFVQDVWRVSGSSGFLAVNAGLRASYWTYNREFLLSPRISLGFIPDNAPQWTLRFATGLYYQSPIYKEYRVPVADTDGNQVIRLNPDIKSPRSLQFITGTDYTFRALGRPFRFSVEAYYKALSRLIPYEIDNLRLIYSGRNEADGYVAGLDMKLFGQFVPGSDSWVSVSVMKSNEKLYGINVPLPTDRRYSLGIFFTDYFPKFPKLKFSLKGILMDGLPAVSPHTSRADGYFRMPPYKRVDVGLSYALVAPPEAGEYRPGLGRPFKSVWLGVDVFNLLDIANVASYYWVTDVNNIRYAVPNYLTRRQFNVRLVMDF